MAITIDDLQSEAWTGLFDAIDAEDRHYFKRELAREVCDSYVLSGQQVTAMAQGGNGDDIVFFVHASPPRLAVVHLTYNANRETSPDWPSTGIYDTLAELLTDIEDI